MEEDEQYRRTTEDIAFLVEKAKAFDEDSDASSEFTTANSDTVQAILQAHGVSKVVYSCQQTVLKGQGDDFEDCPEVVAAVEQLLTDPKLLPDNVLEPKMEGQLPVPVTNWRKLQMEDRNIKLVLDSIEKNEPVAPLNPELKVYAREQKKLAMKEKVLFRRVEDEGQPVRWQLVLPSSRRAEALKGVHDDLFHT